MDPAPAYPLLDGFDLPAVEADVLARWEAEDTFARSLALRAGAPHFVFHEGPPTANGRPGIHHVMARTIKDLVCRYKTMKGFRVDRKAGWDTHGLPVEIEVEKELGLKSRDEIEAYGIARYNAACRASVLRYKDLWDRLTVRMGYWVDLSDPYVTFENSYIESVWNLLSRIHERGLLARGERIQWYSPASGTVLSSHEVSLGYREIQDPSCVVRARLTQDERTSLLAWTTTPWTIPGNVAMAVGEHIRYVRVRQTAPDGSEEFLILAAARAGAVLKGDFEIVDEFAGRDLVGQTYLPMWPQAGERIGPADAWRVVAADYVTTDDGTGIVHTAPAFGADDFATGQREGLPTLCAVRPDGTFEPDMPVVGGLWFKDADRPILRELASRGLLYREDSYVHNYPHDWRKGTPLMQYPVEGWFIHTTAVKDRMVALNETIRWQPEGVGTGRFGQWLENNVDWALSRRRFWGTPLPVWVSDRDPSVVEVIGSVDDLRARAGGAFPPEAINPDTGDVDLHRPYVDAITWPDGAGGTMRRVPDLIDVWFDSGAMPYAQWHYPFENVERFESNAPADFIAEGVDQTRGWFYTLHAIATLVDDRVAYRNVLVNGLVLDAEGRKMSKSLGNTVDPFAELERHGADAVRWTMMSAAAPWEDVRYSEAAVEQTRRTLFGTLANTYRFFAQYAALDGYRYQAAAAVPDEARTELDRWILSRLQATIAEADAALDAYHPTRAARAVEEFVDALSNWFLRRSRRRFWDKASGEPSAASAPDLAKQAAYDTLFECLRATALLMAPIAPMTADWLWSALGEPGSVHLADFPAPDAARADEALDARMAVARAVVTATLALRNDAGIGVRQPLPALAVVAGPGGVDEDALRAVEAVILDEVNVKRLDVLTGADGGLAVEARPNFKALGRRLGSRMKAATAAIRALGPSAVTEYEATGRLVLEIDGETVAFEPGDIDVVRTGAEGRAVRQEAVDGGGLAVVMLDTTLTPPLVAEGLAREIVNRVQNLRKDAGLHVADRIHLAVAGPPAVAEALASHGAHVQAETLATQLVALPALAPEAAPGEARATARLTVDGAPADVDLSLVRVDA